jgi:thioredoxin reductase (NADPH)
MRLRSPACRGDVATRSADRRTVAPRELQGSNGISGKLAEDREFGRVLLLREGVQASFVDGKIVACLADGTKMVAKTNICATGVEWRRLGLAEEARFVGRGFYYGAGMSEAALCRNEHVYIVGGANSAGQAAMHLAEYANQVTILVRSAALKETMSSYLSTRILSHPKIHVRFNSEVSELDGDGALETIGIRTAGLAASNGCRRHACSSP